MTLFGFFNKNKRSTVPLDANVPFVVPPTLSDLNEEELEVFRGLWSKAHFDNGKDIPSNPVEGGMDYWHKYINIKGVWRMVRFYEPYIGAVIDCLADPDDALVYFIGMAQKKYKQNLVSEAQRQEKDRLERQNKEKSGKVENLVSSYIYTERL